MLVDSAAPYAVRDTSTSLPDTISFHPLGTATALPITLRPYGVLGEQLRSSGVFRNAPEPDADTPIIDPAGLQYIQGHADHISAGGASREIYRWLRFASGSPFPEPIRTSIQQPSQAKLHDYNGKAVIHVAAPDFRERECPREQAIAELAQAYRAAFEELAASRYRQLRGPSRARTPDHHTRRPLARGLLVDPRPASCDTRLHTRDVHF